ncbi:MAG TPA: twin-arginine translocase subunit TatC [bacterium]|nr:twin-arginine translocase subunit TatC [bacterium]
MAGDSEKRMTFLEHLEDLRWTIIWILVATTAASVAAWYYTDQIIGFVGSDLARILTKIYGPGTSYDLHVFDVSEAFNVRVKVALLVGFLASLPFSIYKIWQFISPGLFARERRTTAPLIILSIFLFYAGVVFAYCVVVKMTVSFLFRMKPASVVATVRLGSYFSFVAKFCLTFGLVFQMPLVMALLAWLGLVPTRILKAGWRYAVVIILIIAAILTPPDVVSQTMMAVPMLLLYWLGYALAKAFERRAGRAVSP